MLRMHLWCGYPWRAVLLLGFALLGLAGPMARADLSPYVGAVEQEVARRTCIEECQKRHGTSYPCAAQCTFDWCVRAHSETEDRRFMPPGGIPPDCYPHHQVLQQALTQYRENRSRIDLDGIRRLIEEARREAQAARELIAKVENAWQLAEKTEKSAAWADGEIKKAERIVSDAKNACSKAPALADLDAARKEIVAAANEARDLLSRTRAFADEACKISRMIAADDRDPYRSNRFQKVNSLLDNAKSHSGLMGGAAQRAAQKVGQILGMEKARQDARWRWEAGRNAIAPAVVSASFAETEINGLLAQIEGLAPLLDQAEAHANKAAGLKKEALALIENQHNKTMVRSSVSLSEQERAALAAQLDSLIQPAKAVDVPSVKSARKTLAQARQQIGKALTLARRAQDRANTLEAALVGACAGIDQPMSDIIMEAQGAADETQRAKQQAETVVAEAAVCGGSAPSAAAGPAGLSSICEAWFPGSRSVYVESTNTTICLCPDGRQADPRLGCGTMGDPRCIDIGNRLTGARDIATAQAVIDEARQLGCPVSDAAIAQWNRQYHQSVCEVYGQRLWATTDANTANGVLREANAAGCNLQRAVQAWNDRQRQMAGQRAQQQQLQQMQNMLQGTQGMRPPSRTPPTATPSQTSRPPTPVRQCQDVCVEWKEGWNNVTDGRHSLCAGGVARPPGPGLRPPKCEHWKRCVRTERRCR